MKPWRICVSASDHGRITKHLFRGDGREHAALLAASVVNFDREHRLLVREVFLAEDGVDHILSRNGNLSLSPEFVAEKVAFCADERLAYLSVHNHSGTDSVAFSMVDLRAHEQLYPTLLEITNFPVGGLVFAHSAVAGDIWLPQGERARLDSYTVASLARKEFRDAPLANAREQGTHHRQSLLLGSTGQALLRRLKVGVIGAGGVGSIVIEVLARLGVGHVVVVDPDRIEESNFSRLIGSRVADYRPPWWRKPTRKIDIARRVFRNANPKGRIDCIFDDFRRSSVVKKFTDCDALFLAADPPSVKLLFNQLCYQYLLPGIAIGARVRVDPENGNVLQATSSVRLVGPDGACLWCNGFVTPSMLNDEATTAEQRRAQRYIDDPAVAAPSVITLNAQAAGYAMNLFLFGVTGIGAPPDCESIVFNALDFSIMETRALPSMANCPNCLRRYARGSSMQLTTIATDG